MTVFDAYLNNLADDRGGEGYLEDHRDKELAYMRLHAWRFRQVARLLPEPSRSLRVLDIGTTPFTLFLKQHLEGEVWTLDKTGLLGERCRRAGVRLRTCDLDEAVLPFDEGTFDLVLFMEVLEHVFAPHSRVLGETRRILSPGGKLLLSVPNIARIENRARFLWGTSPLPHPDEQMRDNQFHGHGHIHEYTRGELVSLCRSAGLRVGRARMISKRPGDVLRMPKPSLTKLLHAILNVMTPPTWKAHVLLECGRDEGAGARRERADEDEARRVA